MNLPSALWNGVRAVALRAPRANALEAGPGLFFALVGIYLLVALAIAQNTYGVLNSRPIDLPIVAST